MKQAARAGSRRRLLNILVVVLAAMAFSVWRIVAGDPVTEAIEARLLDLRFQARGPVTAPASVVIIAVDERAVTELGWAPPPRRAFAEALRQVLDAEPSAVGLDFLFVEKTGAGPALGAAIAADDRVVVAAAVTDDDRNIGEEWAPELRRAIDRSAMAVVLDPSHSGTGRPPPKLLLPHPDMAAGGNLGHVNIALSGDRVARRVPLGLWIGDTTYLPAMALEVARISERVPPGRVILSPGRFVLFGDRRIDTDRAGGVVLDPYGGRGAITTIGLVDVLTGQFDPADIRDRTVFVGATAESLGDRFATPYSAGVPGVEILATLAANLLGRDLIRRNAETRSLDVTLAVFLAALLSSLMFLPRQGAAFLAAALMWIGTLIGLQVAFNEWRLWLDATTLIATLVFTTGWMAAHRLWMEKRLSSEMKAQRTNLANYVSPALAEMLARGSVDRLDQSTHDAAVMFADVAGYTALSETLAPSDTAVFLRELHRLFERCATAHGGIITVFVGDGAMIVFGLAETDRGDAASAVRCGRMLLDEAAVFSSDAIRGQRLALRISIHFGPVKTAILGGDRQAQVTVTGDTVNVASRLQEVAKAHSTPFVISRAVYDSANLHQERNAADFLPLPRQSIRGRGETVDVFGLGSDR